MARSGVCVREPPFFCGDWRQLPALKATRTICRSKPRRSRRVPPTVAGRVPTSKGIEHHAMPLSPPLEQTRKRRRDFAVGFIPVAATAATGF